MRDFWLKGDWALDGYYKNYAPLHVVLIDGQAHCGLKLEAKTKAYRHHIGDTRLRLTSDGAIAGLDWCQGITFYADAGQIDRIGRHHFWRAPG